MGYGDRNYSPSSTEPGSQKPAKLNPANPVDDVVAGLIQSAVNKGRGFTLGIAPEGDRTKIEVVESLQPHDEYQRPADDRNHTFDDTQSLIDYAKRYGKKATSVIFIGEEQTRLVLDDSVERGDRESCSLKWRPSQDWRDWAELLNKSIAHKDLLRYLQVHEHNLMNAEMLVNLSQISTTATVRAESDINDLGERYGIMFDSKKGESLAKFPKSITIALPVLDEDIDRDPAKRAEVTLNVEVIMPTDANKPVVCFKLYTSQWAATWRARLAEEEALIREELDGWLILRGNAGWKPKPIGEDA